MTQRHGAIESGFAATAHRRRLFRSASRAGVVVTVLAAAAVAWSSRRPLVVDGDGWRFGLIDTTLGMETWDAAALPPGAVVAAGPWGLMSYVDPPVIVDKRVADAGVTNGVSWWYVSGWVGVALLAVWPAGMALVAARRSGRGGGI